MTSTMRPQVSTSPVRGAGGAGSESEDVSLPLSPRRASSASYATVVDHAYGHHPHAHAHAWPLRSPGLHTHFEEETDESDADVGDDCEVKTGSTVSLHHYRHSEVSDQPADATQYMNTPATTDFWNDVNKTPKVPTPPKSPQSQSPRSPVSPISPERTNWPLPISPKTIPRPLPVSPPDHHLPPSPRQDDQVSESSVDVWDDLTPRNPGQTFPAPLAPISLGAPGWPLSRDSAGVLSSSPSSYSTISLQTAPNPPPIAFPIRTQSLININHQVNRPLDRPITTQSQRSFHGPWTRGSPQTLSPTGYDYQDPHPGILVDPSRVDDHDGCDHQRPPTSASTLSKSFNDFAPSRKIPMLAGYTPTSVLDYFPKNGNGFAGFCKCSWRLQTNQTEKAFVVRTILPQGIKNAAERRNSKITTLKCKKCPFEGPLSDVPVPTNVSPKIAPLVEYAFRADRSARSAHGVTYNWNFLFKSHIPVQTVLKKDEILDPQTQTFACLFCCALGNGTVCFDGAATLCGHIARHHPEGVPPGIGERELALRVKLFVGKAPRQTEDWDIILPGHYQTYSKHEQKERAFSMA